MLFFFFNQKTAYDMRISDWISDVCSSDYDRMFIRHWDTWGDGRLNRIFVASLDGKAPVISATLVGGDLIADVPSKPFGDLSDKIGRASCRERVCQNW